MTASSLSRLVRGSAAALGLLLLLGNTSPARAQGGLIISAAPPPEYQFGDQAVFQVSVLSTASITDLTLYYRPSAEDRTAAGSAQFDPGQNVTGAYTLDLAAHPLPPFAPVQFWWEARDSAGQRVVSEPQTFIYEDNRFAWQTVEQGGVTVHWYDGDGVFGQIAVDTADAALEQISRLLDTASPEAVNIYIYAAQADLRGTLTAGGRAWAGGHADPALGVVAVVVAPDLAAGQSLGRAVPHELTHLLIYAAASPNYARVPAWLNEGLAMLNEQSPDPALAGTLSAARDTGGLLKVADLCGPFPADPAQAQLAYAESESLVRFVRDRYGEDKLRALLGAYAAGVDCGSGVEQALGVTLSALERRWLAEVVRANPSLLQLRVLTPWLVLGGLVLAGPLLAALLGRAGRPHRVV